MAEINIKLRGIEDTVAKLQNITTSQITPPAASGGGPVADELEAIAALYKSIDTSFSTLLQNTIAFLQNVENSFVQSDQKARDHMNGG